ncbi:MAG: succinylglutamate desuccinylase/aspartoacylase family protein [Candidatus Nezhaarchaeota archaeon]|nr:succinylglutamate desuccinylase/aspartoacylase family protein [Candidatus Nezhaarchaeota archaeon]
MNALRVELEVGESCDGSTLTVKGLLLKGGEGPVVALTSSVHGVEVNGFEVMRRLYNRVRREGKLKGSLLLLPMVNPWAVAARSVATPFDSVNLNRVFPGRPTGTLSERVAHAVSRALREFDVDYLVDFHGGGYCCESTPHGAAVDVGDSRALAGAVELAKYMGFRYLAVLRRAELEEELRLKATLDSSAMRMGIPSIIADFGSWGYQLGYVKEAVGGLLNVLRHLGALQGEAEEHGDPIIVERVWVRTNSGGMFYPRAKLLSQVDEGDLLGVVVNPFFEVVEEVKAPCSGVVLLMRNYPPTLSGEEAAMIGRRAEAQTSS